MSTMTSTVASSVAGPGSHRRPTTARATAHPSVARRRTPPAGPLHLTRRGRVVVVLVLLMAVLVVGFLVGHVSHAPAAESGGTRVVVVQPGDSLWSIAARAEPGHDTRRVVAQLVAVNHLHGASVQVGERLTVPV